MGFATEQPSRIQLNMSGLLKIVLVVLALGLAEAGHSSYGGGSYRKRPAPRVASKSIAELVIADKKNFSTLLAAVEAAGLVETLSGPGTFTVFAPTNAAFAKIPESALNGLISNPAALKEVLLRHVLPNKIPSYAIPSGSTTVGTVGGEDITVMRSMSKIKIMSSAGEAMV